MTAHQRPPAAGHQLDYRISFLAQFPTAKTPVVRAVAEALTRRDLKLITQLSLPRIANQLQFPIHGLHGNSHLLSNLKV